MAKTYSRIIVAAAVCMGALLVLIRVVLVPKTVTDDDLRSLYLTQKADFELLKQMFLEDAANSRRQRLAVVPSDRTSAELNGIQAARFEQYRALLKRMGVISMHGEKDYVNFLVRSVGWAGEGRRQGLSWREKPPADTGKVEKSHFVHIEHGWYVFDFAQ